MDVGPPMKRRPKAASPVDQCDQDLRGGDYHCRAPHACPSAHQRRRIAEQKHRRLNPGAHTVAAPSTLEHPGLEVIRQPLMNEFENAGDVVDSLLGFIELGVLN